MGGRIEKAGGMRVRGDDGDLVGVVDGQVGVDEDKEVCDEGGQGQSVGQEAPGVRVCVEDDGQQGGRLRRLRLCVA